MGGTRQRCLKNSTGALQRLPATQIFKSLQANDPISLIRPRWRPPSPGPSLFLPVSDSAGVAAGTCRRWPRPRTPPPGSRSLRSQEGSAKGPPTSRLTQGKGNRDAPESPLAKSGRRVLSLPTAAPTRLSAPESRDPSWRAKSTRAPPRQCRSGPRPPSRAPRRRGPLTHTARSAAASARPSRVPAPPSPDHVPDPGRARPRPPPRSPDSVPEPRSPVPGPRPNSRPQLRSPRARSSVPLRAPSPLPAPQEQTPAPARPRQRGWRRVPPSSTWASGGAVPWGDGRSRQGAEQREQRAGGPVLLARGRARRRAPSRRRGQSPPPRPGRPVTWIHRPNKAARSRRARGPVRPCDLSALARWD